MVALFTRAWIEMSSSMSLEKAADVALFTRAWIEIPFANMQAISIALSPSLRGRGLKS